jgi:hypothetical protein
LVEGDLDPILFNPVSSTISKWRAFKLLRWMKNVDHLTLDYDILYADKFSNDEHPFNKIAFVKEEVRTSTAVESKIKNKKNMETTHESMH